MTWSKLTTRLNDLPLVLCGPILRRVDGSSTTVWIALREPRKITLRVYTADADPSKRVKVQEGTRNTFPLGRHLHVVAVTANGNLAWSQIYVYDLRFGLIGNDLVSVPEDKSGLFDAKILAAEGTDSRKLILYESNELPPGVLPLDLPSFATLPLDLNNVRLIHGSCRKPHGEEQDAMQILDLLIRNTLNNPMLRPHQLFLTGDQIYADDVADALLAMLTDAGETLLGWEEDLPTSDGMKKPKEFLPGRRSKVANKASGITSGEAKSHLLSLGEFYAMYLFAWSTVLWPVKPPEFSDVYAKEWEENQVDPDKKRHRKLIEGFNKELSRLGKYKLALPRVRRALANIPMFTIFDDHEITDDWYLDQEWCENALKPKISRRVISNGLLAYAIFQAWGNTPWQFAEDSAGEVGRKLLHAAGQWNGTDSHTALSEIQLLVGLNQPEDVITKKKLVNPAGALQWNYYLGANVNGPPIEIIVLDTRTWRGFPQGKKGPAALIADEEALERQIPLKPPPGKEGITVVISPTPVLGVSLVEDIVQANAPYPFSRAVDRESWSHYRPSLELLISRLVRRSSRLIVLSGDVHYGFSAHLSYWAHRPFGTLAPKEEPVFQTAVIAQLTSSALKNESSWPPTHFLHNHGFVPGIGIPEPQSLAGWHKNPILKFPYYLTTTTTDPPLWKINPLTIPLAVSAPPDWIYRIDYILSEPRMSTPSAIPKPELWDTQTYLQSLKEYRKYMAEDAPGREIVGRNNIGEITFSWGLDDEKSVTHQIWWWLSPTAQPLPLSKYIVSLKLTDPRYPQPKPINVDPSVDYR